MDSSSTEKARGETMLAIVVVVAWTIKCCLLLAMIAYVRRHRSVARKGDSNAARKLILPAFAPFLWILACTTSIVVVAMVLLIAMGVFRTASSAVTREGFYCGHQFVFLLVIVFMHQKSVSIPALRRSVVISLVLATYTFPLVVYCEYWGDKSKGGFYATIERLLRLLIVVWYVYVITNPPSRASKKVIRELCVFTVIYQALSFTSVELLRPIDGSTREISSPVAYIAVLWAAMSPLLIWRVLQADTEHWRGMGERACALENVTRHKHEVQEHVSSQGLHVLIEMHRKLLIDFAYLELRSKIGVGSSAEVFDGLLQSRIPVAIKVYAPLTLSDEVVAGFSQEAALCGALDHPNIVTFHGMCVYPPTICLVFELCQGSLDDLLRTNHERKQSASRQQLSINVGYMIDAARAVAYLHSFSPGFLHRDIKPSNFLVDSEQNVKLADFGESRRLVMDDGLTCETKRPSQDLSINREPAPRIASPSRHDARESARQMTVTGTVDYMAPELINSKGGVATYGEASDVYSLAMTMWDILYPGQERYKGRRHHLHIFQAVLDGDRPELSADLHPMLRDIITSAWQVNPYRRPSAQSVVEVLETLQEEVTTDLLADCFDDSGWQGLTLPVDCRSDSTSRTNFTGAEAVQMMANNHYVDSVSEALRMGRMWMDAGIMHHAKHSQGFTNDGARFYLDADQFHFYQHRIQSQYQYQLQDRDSDALSPIDELVRPASFVSSRTGGSSNGETHMSSASVAQLHREMLDAHQPSCACRRFGLRQLGTAKTTTKRSRFHRKKKALAVEETLLTVALLGEAERATRIEIGEIASDSSTRQERRNTDRQGQAHRNDAC